MKRSLLSQVSCFQEQVSAGLIIALSFMILLLLILMLFLVVVCGGTLFEVAGSSCYRFPVSLLLLLLLLLTAPMINPSVTRLIRPILL